MTNLFLSITLLTNANVYRLDATNTIPQHLYTILATHDAGQPVTNWSVGYPFVAVGNYYSFFEWPNESNAFFMIQDCGTNISQ